MESLSIKSETVKLSGSINLVLKKFILSDYVVKDSLINSLFLNIVHHRNLILVNILQWTAKSFPKFYLYFNNSWFIRQTFVSLHFSSAKKFIFHIFSCVCLEHLSQQQPWISLKNIISLEIENKLTVNVKHFYFIIVIIQKLRISQVYLVFN